MTVYSNIIRILGEGAAQAVFRTVHTPVDIKLPISN
jgi:hypothetical protein